MKMLIDFKSLICPLRSKLAFIKTKYMAKYFPRVEANRIYRGVFNKDINWKHPTNLIEKIYWLQLNTDTRKWTLCADKYRVRDYVTECGCEDLLNELYGVWFCPEEIQYEKLPNSFVLKTNNSSGQVIVVKDKSQIDVDDINLKLRQWLNITYGYDGAQMHYTRIAPCIIAEKLLVTNDSTNESLIDYKIWCFHGEPECILVVHNRTSPSDYQLSMYDLNWNNISDFSLNKQNPHYSGISIPCPSSLPKMLDVARSLSKDFPEVRVDFYEINQKPIFGEMTFTTGYGYHTMEFYEFLGAKITLSK